MKSKLLITTMLFVTLWGCKDDEPSATLLLPSNLNIEITVSEENEGLVSVKATANDENYYTIRFEDGENTEEVEEKN